MSVDSKHSAVVAQTSGQESGTAMSEEARIDAVAASILDQYKKAFEELAK